jgi:hypothetical protein
MAGSYTSLAVLYKSSRLHCKPVPHNAVTILASKCKQMQANASKCKQMQANASKCKQMQAKMYRIYLFGVPLLFGISKAVSVSQQHTTSCSNIKAPSLPGAKVISIQGTERLNFTVKANPPLLANDITNLNICDVEISLTHPGARDQVLVQVWLPLSDWNNRFVAAGGSGWAAGLGAFGLAPLAAKGFAVASTDAGLSGDPFRPDLWALNKDGTVNEDLLLNFASRSVHDMAVAGKAVTQAYYGTQAKYSYWNGCSTGGRQGMVEAQKYPGDFDGILAGAPAIYWPEYVVAEQWPQVVMKEADTFPSNCELDAVTQAAIHACDGLDGVKDNVITDLSNCRYDPFEAVGLSVQCDGKNTTISPAIASVVQKIWQGPTTSKGAPWWYGLNRGAPLNYLANITTTINGTRTGFPFFVNDAWIRYFVQEDPGFNLSNVGAAELNRIFLESKLKYDSVIGSANPDLSAFRRTGGRLLVWQGQADQLIFPEGTTQYRRLVEKLMGGTSRVDNFFRLFLAPGVDHCGGGLTAAAVPTDQFEALMRWVEDGKEPDELHAATLPSAHMQFTRKICRYPLVSKYRGFGNPSSSQSYYCVAC